MGAGLVLMAVAAVAVPAWAADGDTTTAAEVTTDSATAGEVGTIETDDSQGMLALPSKEERERIDKCMTEHGFGPGSGPPAAVEMVPPDDGDATEVPPAPEPDSAFKKAADDCGLPAPGVAIAAVGNVADARGGELCALPPPPEIRRLDPQDDQ
jgi:hypothetical protein